MFFSFVRLVVLLAINVSCGFAKDLTSVNQIPKKDLILIKKAVSNYAEGIGCMGNIKDILVLKQASGGDSGYMDEEYAVIFSNNIGCAGGNRSTHDDIAIVTRGEISPHGFYIWPQRSSPAINFEYFPLVFIDKIISHTDTSMVVEGSAWADGDPMCCPSIDSIGEMRRDLDGNWTLVRLAPKDKKETRRFAGDKF